MSSVNISDISTPTDLEPKKKYFAEADDVCINVDAALELINVVNNERTRIIKKAFRHQLSLVRSESPEMDASKQREEAFFRALGAVGIKTTFKKLDGKFD